MKIGMIDILGTAYEIKSATRKEDASLHGRGGYCDQTTKEIVLLREFDPDIYEASDTAVISRCILRHELMHAFFYESGMQEWFDNEMLVSWMAMQIPKIAQVMVSIGAIILENEGGDSNGKNDEG